MPTVWGVLKRPKKLESGLTIADIGVGTSHTLEDLACQDYFCTTMDIIATVSTAVGAYLGNHPDPKNRKLTRLTGSITTRARAIKWYCKNYVTFWGCTVALTNGAKKSLHFIVNQK
jgi:hypothetical protein